MKAAYQDRELVLFAADILMVLSTGPMAELPNLGPLIWLWTLLQARPQVLRAIPSGDVDGQVGAEGVE